MGKRTLIDLRGQKFSRLMVLERRKNTPDNGASWLCLCDCGKKKIISSAAIRTGNTLSCGCLKRELDKTRNLIHGMSRSPENAIRSAMIQRCTNPNSKDYPYYGGRGIRVCKRWLRSFENFFADMGKRPSKKFELDRKNNNGDYKKTNCRWITHTEQMNNTRSNRVISFNGYSKNISQWAKHIGINNQTLSERLERWTVEKALNTPKMK